MCEVKTFKQSLCKCGHDVTSHKTWGDGMFHIGACSECECKTLIFQDEERCSRCNLIYGSRFLTNGVCSDCRKRNPHVEQAT